MSVSTDKTPITSPYNLQESEFNYKANTITFQS